MVLRDDGGLAARDRRQYVDGRIVVLLRELARKNDVPVENGACLVGYRLGHVIAFDKDGVERGYGTLGGIARAFHELWKFGKDARRETASRRRLSCGKADFALRPPEARHGVHEKKNLHSLVAEALRNRGRNVCRLETLHRRTIGRRYDEHRPLLPLGAEVLLDKLPDLASALANESKDSDVCFGVADNRREQSRLASAGGREDAHALPLAAGEKPVNRADAKRYRLGDDRSLQRRGRRRIDGVVAVRPERPLRVGVHRRAEAVKDTAEEIHADGHHLHAPGRDDLGLGGDADHRSERRQQRGVLGEADYLCMDLVLFPRIPENADFADFHSRHRRLDDRADHLDHLALHVDGLGILHGTVENRRNIVERRRHAPAPFPESPVCPFLPDR